MSDSDPVFYYDFSSPYSYFAAHRVDELFSTPVRWQPIAFGVLIREIGKTPWSFAGQPGREQGMAECQQRAADLGLPLIWPSGWPTDTYSIQALRGALVAANQGKLKEFSLAAFDEGLGRGNNLRELEVLLRCADRSGISRESFQSDIESEAVKQELLEVTADATAQGVTGVPTVKVGTELFWGDDHLEEAAAACQ